MTVAFAIYFLALQTGTADPTLQRPNTARDIGQIDEDVQAEHDTELHKSGIKEQENNTLVSTLGLTEKQVRQRRIWFQSSIAVCSAALILFAVVAHIYKTGKCELPWIAWQGCTCPPVHIVSVDVIPKFRELRGPYTRLVESPPELELQEPFGVVEVGEAPELELQLQEPAHIDDITTSGDIRKAKERYYQDNKMRRETATMWRKVVQCILFAMYVFVCTLVPYMNRGTTSCMKGFFWETHMIFFGVFVFTKFVEIVIYVVDPSIDGELPLWKFMLLFFPSFFGYTDGYQDSTSIYIADACADDLSAPVDHPLAGLLAQTMFWSFVVGVVLAQWFCVGILAVTRDRTLAVLAKLVHMDALALCISVPESDLWMLHLVNGVRTFLEDLPQAVQQTVFVVRVRVNFFMIVSIAFSVGCSFKAFCEALSRASQAAGFDEKLKRLMQEQGEAKEEEEARKREEEEAREEPEEAEGDEAAADRIEALYKAELEAEIKDLEAKEDKARQEGRDGIGDADAYRMKELRKEMEEISKKKAPKKRAGDFKIVRKAEQNRTPGYRLARKEEAEQVVDDLEIPFNYICSLELPHKIGGPRSGTNRNWFGADSTGDEGHALLVRLP